MSGLNGFRMILGRPLAALFFLGALFTPAFAETITLAPADTRLPLVHLEVGFPGDFTDWAFLPVAWRLEGRGEAFEGEIAFSFQVSITDLRIDSEVSAPGQRFAVQKTGDGTPGTPRLRKSQAPSRYTGKPLTRLIGTQCGAEIQIPARGEARGFTRAPGHPMSNRRFIGGGHTVSAFVQVTLYDRAGARIWSDAAPLRTRLLGYEIPVLRVDEGLFAATTLSYPQRRDWQLRDSPVPGIPPAVARVSAGSFSADLVPLRFGVVTVTFDAWFRLKPEDRRALLRWSPHGMLWIVGLPSGDARLQDEELLPVVFSPGRTVISNPWPSESPRRIESEWTWAAVDDRAWTIGGPMPWLATTGSIFFLAVDPWKGPPALSMAKIDLLMNAVGAWWPAPTVNIEPWGQVTVRGGRDPRLVLLAASSLFPAVAFFVLRRRLRDWFIGWIALAALTITAIGIARASMSGEGRAAATRLDGTVGSATLRYERRGTSSFRQDDRIEIEAEEGSPAIPSIVGQDPADMPSILQGHDGIRDLRIIRSGGVWRLRGWKWRAGLYSMDARLDAGVPRTEAIRASYDPTSDRVSIQVHASPGGGSAEVWRRRSGSRWARARLGLPGGSSSSVETSFGDDCLGSRCPLGFAMEDEITSGLPTVPAIWQTRQAEGGIESFFVLWKEAGRESVEHVDQIPIDRASDPARPGFSSYGWQSCEGVRRILTFVPSDAKWPDEGGSLRINLEGSPPGSSVGRGLCADREAALSMRYETLAREHAEPREFVAETSAAALRSICPPGSFMEVSLPLSDGPSCDVRPVSVRLTP